MTPATTMMPTETFTTTMEEQDIASKDYNFDQVYQLAPLIIDMNEHTKKKKKPLRRDGNCRESRNNDDGIIVATADHIMNVITMRKKAQCRTKPYERPDRNLIGHQHFEEIRNEFLNGKKESTSLVSMALTKSKPSAARRRHRKRLIDSSWKRRLLVMVIFPFVQFLVVVAVGSESSSISSSSRLHSTQHGVGDPISNSNRGSSISNIPAPAEKGIVRIVENEIWDPSTNEWKGQTPRWTSTTSTTGAGSDVPQQQLSSSSSSSSSSPAEFVPSDGWKFQGDWKIVVNQNQIKKDDSSSSGSSVGDSALGQAPGAKNASPATDAMGWEYIYQYLRPPKRRRVWLRTIVPQSVVQKKFDKRQVQEEAPTKQLPASTAEKGSSSKTLEDQQSDRLLKTRETLSRRHVSIPSALRKISPAFLQADMIRSVRDDFNFKGLGMSLYKSLIFPESFGCGLRLPLTANFDVFDRNPGLPSVSSTLSLYGPSWTIIAGLSCSVTVEWIKWVIRNAVWSISRAFVLVWYRLIMPILLVLKAALDRLVHPVHRISQKEDAEISPSSSKSSSSSSSIMIPSNIQNFLSTPVSRPMYNSELSERVGCSVSYRWSQKYGFEFRVSYWHSYLPTLLMYRRLMSKMQQHDVVQKLVSRTIHQQQKQKRSSVDIDTKDSYKSLSLSSTTTNNNNNNIDWWRKHFASVGIGTSYPTRDPPYISCNTQLSLSGFNFEGMRLKKKLFMATTSDKKVLGKPILDNIEKNVDLVSSAKAVIADKMREGVESSDDRHPIDQGKNRKKIEF